MAGIRKAQVLAVVGLAFFWQLFRFSNLRALFGAAMPGTTSGNEAFLVLMAVAVVLAGVASLQGGLSRALARPEVCAVCCAAQLVLSLVLGALGSAVPSAVALGTQVATVSLCLVTLLFSWTSLLRGLRGGFSGLAATVACSAALAFFFSLLFLYATGDETLLALLMVPAGGAFLLAADRVRAGSPTRLEDKREGEASPSSDAPDGFGAISGAAVRAGLEGPFGGMGFLSLPGGFQNSRSFMLLAVSTALFFLMSLSVSGSISSLDVNLGEGSGIVVKHLATIAEILLFGAVLYVSTDARKALYAGWLLFSGLFLVGVTLMGLRGLGAAGLGVVLATAGRGCFELLLFVLALVLTGRFSPYRCITVAFLLPEVAASVVSRGLLPLAFSQMGIAFGDYVPLVSLVLSAVMVVGVGLLLVVELFARIGRDPREPRAEGSASSSDRDALSSRRMTAQQLFGLSPAERRIADYLMRGYTAEGVAEREHLSVNTVRTHIKNIYRKSGVHSRQEFIDAVDRASAEAPSRAPKG